MDVFAAESIRKLIRAITMTIIVRARPIRVRPHRAKTACRTTIAIDAIKTRALSVDFRAKSPFFPLPPPKLHAAVNAIPSHSSQVYLNAFTRTVGLEFHAHSIR